MKENFITTGRIILLIWMLLVILADAEYQYLFSLVAGVASVYLLMPWWIFESKNIPKDENYDWWNVVGGTVIFILAYVLFMLEL